MFEGSGGADFSHGTRIAKVLPGFSPFNYPLPPPREKKLQIKVVFQVDNWHLSLAIIMMMINKHILEREHILLREHNLIIMMINKQAHLEAGFRV